MPSATSASISSVTLNFDPTSPAKRLSLGNAALGVAEQSLAAVATCTVRLLHQQALLLRVRVFQKHLISEPRFSRSRALETPSVGWVCSRGVF
ncbi:hypothetical protein SBA2_900019 [Acidobacteriia bacterium SbA2]|nr:hypothetical protein SBA2_900019 [Acidobacteriia bacterium SbA2]